LGTSGSALASAGSAARASPLPFRARRLSAGRGRSALVALRASVTSQWAVAATSSWWPTLTVDPACSVLRVERGARPSPATFVVSAWVAMAGRRLVRQRLISFAQGCCLSAGMGACAGSTRLRPCMVEPRRGEAIARHFIDSARESGTAVARSASTSQVSSAGDESAVANGAARRRSVSMSDLSYLLEAARAPLVE
jgi:hypothetical protein